MAGEEGGGRGSLDRKEGREEVRKRRTDGRPTRPWEGGEDECRVRWSKGQV